MMATASSSALTHAGGVVYRMRGEEIEFLLVAARKRAGEWVLPKGHIESDELPQEAARREVREESGVDARIEERLDDVNLQVDGERQAIRFYLMRSESEGTAHEARRIRWAGPADAVRLLSFEESRRLIRAAVPLLARAPDRS